MKRLKYILVFAICTLAVCSVNAHPSWGIVVDENKNIYFADITHKGKGAVWKLTNQGKLVLLLENFHAHNVSLDKDGNLITAHGENNHTMIRLNKNGTIDTLYHRQNHKEFFGGNCTYSPLGEIVFGIENYIWRINEHGDKEKISNHKFEWNQTVYADEFGNYYAPDIGNGIGELIKIDNSGKSQIIATNLISKSGRPYDPHADLLMGTTRGGDGDIYIAEIAGKRIVKIRENQKTETFYTSENDWFPTGIDFFSGEAYILEYKTKNGNEGPRIVKIDESGNKTTIFNYDEYQKGSIFPVGKQKFNSNYWWSYLTFALVMTIFTLGMITLRNYCQYWYKQRINADAPAS